MIFFQKLGIFSSLFVLTLSFSQCASTKKTIEITKTIELSKESSSEVYYQNWVAGVRGGGSGTNLYISKSVVENKELITAYFKGKEVVFDTLIKGSKMFIARFKGDANQIFDMEMNADAINEYGNKAVVEKTDFPFNLEPNDAVVSYLENNTLKYLKLINIPKKESLAYPSAPRN
jgi:hypothetical protein